MNRRERRAKERVERERAARSNGHGPNGAHQDPQDPRESTNSDPRDPRDRTPLPRVTGTPLDELRMESRTIMAIKAQHFEHTRAARRLEPIIEAREQALALRCLAIVDELGIVRLPGDVVVVDDDSGQIFIRRAGQLLSALPPVGSFSWHRPGCDLDDSGR